MAALKPPTRDSIEFGRIIATRRRQRGLSQTELAEMLGISQESLSRLEAGLFPHKFMQLRAFADALECSLYDLFYLVSEDEKDKGQIFAELIHSLSPEWQEAILKTAISMARLARKADQQKAGEDESE